MTDEIRRAWLGLIRAPGLGPMTLQPLLAAGFIPTTLLQARKDLPDVVRKAIAGIPWERVDEDLAWLSEDGNHLLCLGDPDYPPLLADIADAPLGLFVHGDPAVLSLPQLAVVGSRNPTSGGERTARDFARHLAQCGLAITSGLAVGIDAAAHQGALEADGATLAVCGTGLDRVYPARHRELAHQIAERGALVSEFPPGTPPMPGNFPRRNRIISGLSVGTLVVEAALKSGSLITARTAVDQGREVFAIPGSIHNPLARGCHSLIRNGAKLVETADDIAEELTALFGGLLTEGGSGAVGDSDVATGLDDPEYRQLLAAMGYDPVTVDGLVERTGFAAEAVSSMLLLLELQGHVSSAAGGFFTRAGASPE